MNKTPQHIAVRDIEGIRFISAIQRGIEGFTEAATIARDEMSADPEWPERIAEKQPGLLTAESIRRFALLGTKYVPALMFTETPGGKKLRRLPIPLQEKYTREPTALIIRTPSGWETLKCDVNNLTVDQADQVFASDHIRDEAEQRAIIEDRMTKKAVRESPKRSGWRIEGKRIFIPEGVYAPDELIRMLAEAKL